MKSEGKNRYRNTPRNDHLFYNMAALFFVVGGTGVFNSDFLKKQALKIWSNAFLFLHFCTNVEDLVHFYSETVGSHTSSDRDSLHVAMQ